MKSVLFYVALYTEQNGAALDWLYPSQVECSHNTTRETFCDIKDKKTVQQGRE